MPDDKQYPRVHWCNFVGAWVDDADKPLRCEHQGESGFKAAPVRGRKVVLADATVIPADGKKRVVIEADENGVWPSWAVLAASDSCLCSQTVAGFGWWLESDEYQRATFYACEHPNRILKGGDRRLDALSEGGSE